jgi:glycine cleavage system aminomethyltransferase T
VTDPRRIVVDGSSVPLESGDTVLVALARAGRMPAGSLCNSGDCSHCLATVDGVPHLRMCRIPAHPGMTVAPTPVDVHPPLPPDPDPDVVIHRTTHADVVVIGAGEAGRAAAAAECGSVVVLEARDGSEALAVYPGPVVLARVMGEIVRYHCDEVVVATGAADIHPVLPDRLPAGVLTPAAARGFAAAGIDLGTVVWVGTPPQGLECIQVEGPVLRLEGREVLEAIVVTAGGDERRIPCDTVVFDLGRYPRDLLARMATPGEVRVVGSAAEAPTIPPCPSEGIVCPCSDVTVADLDDVWRRGFTEIELLKRATLAGTGTCQGVMCTPYLRSFVLARGGELAPTFTSRPPARQLTVGEAAAGFRLPPAHRTALDEIHRLAGARMDRIGGWYRPWEYPDPDAEYSAVRHAVSLCDVGTLGKMIVAGPDSVAFLERLYPCRVADIRPGRSRYALLLAESGSLMDDGLISRVDDTTFHLSFTSGGASHAEAWVRDWAHAMDVDVRIMDRTHSLGAINVTGPLATALLERVGMDEPMAFMQHGRRAVAGTPCHVYRLSFTGEISYELHHPVRHSAELWNALLAAGADLGVAPHGLRTLQTLRLEKGHIIIGMDTEPDSTPRRLGMEWAVRMDKPEFVGRSALQRLDPLPVRKRLVGLRLDGPAPVDGTPVETDGRLAGYVTSAAWSPAVGASVMLAWLDVIDGDLPTTVTVDGREAGRVPTPFYDPEGARARS